MTTGMKKSQVTIFIVLGIVILIIFGLLFFITRQMSDVVLGSKINKIYNDFLRSSDIQHITETCLDTSTKEALRLIGLQGGKIYNSQIKGGYNITYPNDVIPYNYSGRYPNGIIYNVSYGIKAPLSLSYPDPPDYPYLGALVSSSSLKSPFALYNDLYYPYTLTALCNGYGW